MLENVSKPQYLALSWVENANCFLKRKNAGASGWLSQRNMGLSDFRVVSLNPTLGIEIINK